MSDSLQPHGLSMEFSRPEYWSGQSFPSTGDLPNLVIKPRSPALQVDSLPTELSGKPTLTEFPCCTTPEGVHVNSTTLILCSTQPVWLQKMVLHLNVTGKSCHIFCRDDINVLIELVIRKRNNYYNYSEQLLGNTNY